METNRFSIWRSDLPSTLQNQSGAMVLASFSSAPPKVQVASSRHVIWYFMWSRPRDHFPASILRRWYWVPTGFCRSRLRTFKIYYIPPPSLLPPLLPLSHWLPLQMAPLLLISPHQMHSPHGCRSASSISLFKTLQWLPVAPRIKPRPYLVCKILCELLALPNSLKPS